MSQTLVSNSILNTIYLTFAHNEYVIAISVAAALAGWLAFKQPNRFHLLLLFGFATLIFSYEYEKHIIAPLTEQTLKAIAPVPGTHLLTTRYVDIFLSILLPIFIFISGWFLILWAMITGGKNEL